MNRRRTIVGLACVGLGFTLAACSSSPTASTPASSAPGTSPHGTAVSTAACAWANKADKATQNVAYPDTAATYWVTSYVLAPGEQLEFHGRFPDARYFSFITYGPNGGSNAVITDRDIQPDAGSTNPFAGHGGAAGGGYTVHVRSDTTKAPNAVSAVTPSNAETTGTSPGTTPPGTTVDQTGAPIRLGSGTPGGAGVVGGSVIYRVYLPKAADDDPSGGGGLPDVRVVHADGTTTAVTTCAHPGANPTATALIESKGPPTDAAAPAQPVFLRPKAGAANLYPNPDNVYVVTILHHTPGQLVVVRGKAPTFPDTAAGATITGNEQVRYWSLCTDEYRKPYPVSGCIADHDVPLDAGGNYTFVISTPEDRPANATAANGITWLEWGNTTVDNLLLMRHMLASPDFTESAINLAPGALASTTMGPYAPTGVYCSATAFAAGGPAACPSTIGK